MTELAYDRRGSGPPLVLIHGLGSHRQVWGPVLAGLATRHDVIALDLPGFGESPLWSPAPHAGSVAHLADQVTAFLDRLGVTGFAVAGSSLGGGVALELGRRGRATAVTAFAPVGFWTGAGRRWCQTVVTAARVAAGRLDRRLPAILAAPAGRAAFCSLFYARPRRLDPADAVSAARALAAAPGFAAARDALADLPPWGRELPSSQPELPPSQPELPSWGRDLPPSQPGLPPSQPGLPPSQPGLPPSQPDHSSWQRAQTTVPVTIAWGTRDAVLPFAQSRRARQLLPQARHVTLKGCGHLPFADDPDACQAVLSAPAR